MRDGHVGRERHIRQPGSTLYQVGDVGEGAVVLQGQDLSYRSSWKVRRALMRGAHPQVSTIARVRTGALDGIGGRLLR
jgi:hypothetical protein